MLTLFSIPKAFVGHIGVIQRNAIQSWARLHPNIEVILVGTDEGVAEAALEFGCTHIPEVKRSRFGTPLVSSVFELVEAASHFDKLVYVNADIILLQDFVRAIESIPARGKSLVGGIRWNAPITKPIDFERPDWESEIRDFALKEGKAHGVTGIDYFVFDKGLFNPIPDFAIGRFYWDMWLLYQARKNGADIVDASNDIFAIHQNHDYRHVTSKGDGRSVLKGEEAFENRLLVSRILLHLGDANKRLIGGKIAPHFRWNAAHICNELALSAEASKLLAPLRPATTWFARQFWDRNWRTQYRDVIAARAAKT